MGFDLSTRGKVLKVREMGCGGEWAEGGFMDQVWVDFVWFGLNKKGSKWL